jgi:hypothetical protein
MQIVDRGLFCEGRGRENPGASEQTCISFPFRIYFLLNNAVKYDLSGKNNKSHSSCIIFWSFELNKQTAQNLILGGKIEILLDQG